MTRSELKATDEITTTLERLTETAIARRKQILIVAAAVIAVLGLFFSWRFYASGRTAAAQTQLGRVISAFHDASAKSEKERFEKAIVEAQTTMTTYPSSQAASLAQYYLALSQDGLGDMANAVKNLEEVIGRGDTDITPVAQFALAGVYKRNGEPQKAVDIFKQLDASGGYTKATVAYELGATAEAAGQKDVAQTAYSKVITEFPESMFRREAEAALKRMGLPIPAPAPVPAPTDVKVP